MSSATGTAPILDHIVILVSHKDLDELPTRLQDSLVVAEGGTHAGGKTLNRLILFDDGVYVELIAFAEGIDPEERRKHRWGRLEEGNIIDWAYTLPQESDFRSVQQRVHDIYAKIVYDDPVSGGRTKPDGTILKWATASARFQGGPPTWPGKLPFWCLDRTDRGLRVPYQHNPQTRHPSGARGVSRIALTVPDGEFDAIQRVYDAIHQSAANSERPLNWGFVVPAGSTAGQRSVSLVSSPEAVGIAITLHGDGNGPSSVELLPGLVINIES